MQLLQVSIYINIHTIYIISHTVQYSKIIQQFDNLNLHLSLDELRHQIQLELHPSDFSCVLRIQYDQLVFHLLVSNIIRMIHNSLKFL